MKQLAKQNNSIGKVITNVPSRNVSIYDASKNEIKFKGYLNNNKLMNNIVEVVGSWAFSLGHSDKVTDKDLLLNSKFIQENFSELNIVDLKEAIKLHLTNELNTKTPIKPYYGFAPLFIGEVLSVYRSNRSEIIVDMNKKLLALKAKELMKEPTEAERLSNMKVIIKNAWTDVVLNKRYYSDFGDVIYNFTKRHNLIDYSNKELVEKATIYANKQVKINNTKNAEICAVRDVPFIKENEKFAFRQNGRHYIVSHWLRGMDVKQINAFIETIKKV